MKNSITLFLILFSSIFLYSQNPIARFGTDSLVNTTITAASQQTPDVAMDTAGNYVANWFSFEGTDFDVIAQRYDQNSTILGSRFVVNTNTAGIQINSDLAVDQDGDFVIAWHSFGQDGSRYGIYGQRYDNNGVAQGAEFRVNETTINDQFFPDVAMDTAGNFVVTWHSGISTDYDVYARVYNADGTPRTGEFIVPTTTAGLQYYPSSVMDAEGNFIITWHSESFDGANDDDVYAQRFDANGLKIGGEFRVNTFTTGIQAFGNIGMDQAGNFVIAWWSNLQDGSSTGVFAQRYDKDGIEIGGEFQVNTNTNLEQSYPVVAVEPDGDFMIVWNSEHISGVNEEFDIFLQYFSRDGNKIGDELQVNTTTANSQLSPAVATQKNGQYVVLWQSMNQLSPSSDNDIFHQIYDTSIDPVFEQLEQEKSEFQVNTYYDNRQGPADTAADEDGNFVVVWESVGQDNGTLNIYAQLYDSTCTKMGNEFRVNTTITGTQVKPSVAMNNEGNFVVVWYGNQTGDFDIYARGFDVTGAERIAEFRVNTTTANEQSFPDVAMNRDNNRFIVVWQSDENGLGTDNDVYAKLFSGMGGTQLEEFKVNETTASLQDRPKVARGPSDQFIITWDSDGQDGSGDGIYAKLYDNRGEVVLKSEFQVNTFTPNSQSLPDIAVDENEAYVIVWESISGQDGSERGIFAQRLDANGDKLGGEFQVNSETSLNQGSPSVAKAPNGNFLIGWNSESQDGDSTGVFIQYFEANGNTIGTETQVNTFTTDAQQGIALASNQDGKFVATWSSEKQDGSDRGVFATTFQTNFIYIVNTTDDTNDGSCTDEHCSLREAVIATNTDAGASKIEFNIAGIAPFTISPTTALPIITTNDLNLDASTQPNWALGAIILDGSLVVADGLELSSVENITIKGLRIQNFNIGIDIDAINSSTGDERITVDENIIVSNTSDGILFEGGDVIIQNNFIGTDANGSAGLGNGNDGIAGSEGSALIQNNTVCSNTNGINISTTGNNDILNNRIGTNEFEATGLGNSTNGIRIAGSAQDTITNNVIAQNNNGVNANFASSMLISSNEFFCNSNNGIANAGLTAPSITSFSSNAIVGTSMGGETIEVYLLQDSNCGAAACQGKTLLGITTATTGNWTLNAPYNVSINPNSSVTAIAINGSGNTSAFATCASIGNDECVDAIELPMNDEACGGETVLATLTNATSSNMTALCDPNVSGRDIWFKANVPFSGNFLVRERSGTEIQTLIEAYTGTCADLTALSCAELDSLPNVLVVDTTGTNPTETIYFRVLDSGNDDIGNVELSAHRLPTNSSKWELCSDPTNETEGNLTPGASERVANEVIIQFDANTNPDTIQKIRDELIADGAVLVDACACQSTPLELWRAQNPIELENCIKRATRTRSKVDTTNYNYIIKEVACTGFGYREVFPPYKYTVAQNPISSVKVGIIDSGVESGHFLIQDALWQESDNDGCLISTQYGYDFLNEDALPNDTDGHGTAINGVMVRNFPSEIKLELINSKFAERDEGTLFDAVCGIYYAIEEGAQILNLSWGFESNEFPQILFDALQEAQRRGILVVTSAGNYTANNDLIEKYPSNLNSTLDNIIVVTSYEEDNDQRNPQLANYANFGKNSVDIATYGFLETTSLNSGGNTAELGDYVGTSMAAPLVTRTAALIKGTYPCLTYQDLKQCILESVDAIPVLDTLVKSGGVLNTTKAMACAAEKNCLRVNIKVALEGSYDLQSAEMVATIQLPANEPFGTGNFEVLAPSVQGEKGDATIIDWVLVQLRDQANNLNILAERAALLRRDGRIVDLDGFSELNFPALEADSYFISVQQQNHLGVMTDLPVQLSK